MTRIVVDPHELRDVAISLQRLATESADVGSKLRSSTMSAMPAQVRGLIDQFVARADAVLDEVAVRLLTEAIDLVQRAIFAANDSVATAATVAQAPSTLVIGGSRSPFAILDPSGRPVSPGSNISVVGGHTSSTIATFTTLGGSSVIGGNTGSSYVLADPGGRLLPMSTVMASFSATSIVSAPNWAAGPASGLMAISEAGANIAARVQASVNAIVANPLSSPAMLQTASAATTMIADGISHQLAPSRNTLEQSAGGSLTWPEVASISPNTVPPSQRPGNTSLTTSIFPGGPSYGMFSSGADGVIGHDDILAGRTSGMLTRSRN